jgi:dTDP-4-dehydrorhamnose 3,5-epimerase
LTDLDRPASAIEGVRYGAIARHADERGSFRELWRASARPGGTGPSGTRPSATGPATDDEPAPYVQANLSSSTAGVLRGLHLHQRQQDHWLVSAGRALVALVDVRPLLADPSRGRPIVETRELAEDEWVDIPIGVAHGFLALTALDLIYFVTNEYDGSDEFGFAWDDPQVGVPWPEQGTPFVLSARDRSNPTLMDLVASLRAAS